MQKNIKKEQLYIDSQASLTDALKKMDQLDIKLLIVLSEGLFDGLLSIGDIQRSFIKYQSFSAKVKSAMRQDFTVAKITDTMEETKRTMLKYRTEFMPVVAEDGSLVKIYLWEEIFKEEARAPKKQISLPVVIMAGGKGTRLHPITHVIPKPLVPIGERPILQVIMDNFIEVGCNSFSISVNYKSEMIRSYFNSLDDNIYDISYFEEELPMGTAGSLSLIRDHISSTFFVSNCDIIIKEDYAEIYQYHIDNQNEMTAVAFVKEIEIPYGTLDIGDDGYLKGLKEKPKFTFLVNAGLYILEPHLLTEIPSEEVFHITHLMDKIVNRSGKVGVFPISEGSWLDIGQWKEYQKTLKRFGSEIHL